MITPVVVLFYLAAALTIGGGLVVVMTRNIVYAALALLVSLMGVAGVFLLAFAEFLALVQVLIYGGAIIIVFLFALMLTRIEDFARLNRSSSVAHCGRRRRPHLCSAGCGCGKHRRPHRAGEAECRVLEAGRDAVRAVGGAVRGCVPCSPGGPHRGRGAGAEKRRAGLIELAHFQLLSAALFCIGLYGVLARRSAVLVLMSIELMLNAVNINLIGYAALSRPPRPTASSDRCSSCS